MLISGNNTRRDDIHPVRIACGNHTKVCSESLGTNSRFACNSLHIFPMSVVPSLSYRVCGVLQHVIVSLKKVKSYMEKMKMKVCELNIRGMWLKFTPADRQSQPLINNLVLWKYNGIYRTKWCFVVLWKYNGIYRTNW